MGREIVDATKLVRGLNRRHGKGTFRSRPEFPRTYIKGDVRMLESYDGRRWNFEAWTDDLGRLAEVVDDWGPGGPGE